MTRSMVKYKFMEDASARNVTLKKRKASLLKKMDEVKTLCDVDACLVMYEKEGDPPVLWPSASEARRVVDKFDKSIIWGANSRLDHIGFLKNNLTKMKKHLKKEKKKNLKNSMLKCLFDDNEFSEIKQEDLEGLHAFIDSEIQVIDEMIEKASEKGKMKMA
uniref:agamous-like MADS-box protein AGL80 n=1 Tax=Erigeron canadensis TaxID=72917 RepID=UPI001CB8EC83|nr:agamous-like MADS-box protein AGL80 [Erigeron canadensis]